MNAETALQYMIEAATQAGTPLAIDGENSSAINLAANWLAREPREGLDLNKGLLIVGHVGTGKTMLLRTVRNAMRNAYGLQFGIKSASDLVRQFTENGYEGIEKWMNAPHVCFDDLGSEGEAVHYGKRTNLMAEIIEARYERMMQGIKCWSHFTTNLGTDKILKIYGGRVASRLQQMTNLIEIGGKSVSVDRRKTAPAPAFVPPSKIENVYTAIHPDVMARLHAALRPAGLMATKSDRMEVVTDRPAAPTQAEHIAAFAANIQNPGITLEDLAKYHDDIRKANDSAASEPYLIAIEEEVKRRGTPVVIPLNASA